MRLGYHILPGIIFSQPLTFIVSTKDIQTKLEGFVKIRFYFRYKIAILRDN